MFESYDRLQYVLQIGDNEVSADQAVCRGFAKLYKLPGLTNPEISCYMLGDLPKAIDPAMMAHLLKKRRNLIVGFTLIVGLEPDDVERATLTYLLGCSYLPMSFPNYEEPNEKSEWFLREARAALGLD